MINTSFINIHTIRITTPPASDNPAPLGLTSTVDVARSGLIAANACDRIIYQYTRIDGVKKE